VWELLSLEYVLPAWFSPAYLLLIGGLVTRDVFLCAWSVPLLFLIVAVTLIVLSFVPSL